MDTATYEQIHLSEEALGDSMNYLLPESTINVEFYEGNRSASSCRRRST